MVGVLFFYNIFMDMEKFNVDQEANPIMKYYAFDWDDNLLYMPTKIILIDEDRNKVGMSTKDYSKYESKIGVEPFEYNDSIIKDYADNAFKYFEEGTDSQFVIDSLMAEPGPAWSDFVDAVNNGCIFSIITARGHNPDTLKESCYNMIISNKNGLRRDELLSNLEKFRDFEDTNKKNMILDYLDLCRFYPVTYKTKSGIEIPRLKSIAMKKFIQYIKDYSNQIKEKSFLKNKISNSFNPRLEYSDNDEKNIKELESRFKKEINSNFLNLYLKE
jgi:hypothetical protein